MKKLASLIIVLALSLSLTACWGQEKTPGDTSDAGINVNVDNKAVEPIRSDSEDVGINLNVKGPDSTPKNEDVGINVNVKK